ncbi:MAG TPA: sigma-54-dependent Fis family transcriptional regulator [Nitrospiraceae bacterium]|nr:sigma-54-dependent Fis family transcriptional regulator [Nitrospiraceae bacterium]
MKSKGKVFILDDDDLILSMLSKVLTMDGYEVSPESTTDDIINKIRSFQPDVVLLDIRLPKRNGIDILRDIKSEGLSAEVIMLTADDTAETAVRAMKLGAVDYLTKPFNIEEVKIVVNNVIEKENLKQEVAYLRKVYSETFEREFIGKSKAIQDLVSQMQKLAQARVSSILITGESGTGKEVVARNIHHFMYGPASSRVAPFIWINCAAMPETILESELFGYEKGAFTDAKADRKGLFEMAKGGSLLLDEIGDMKTELQSKLLRVLEERTIRRIGGGKEIPIDVTVIATTNKNLSDAVQNGEFRKDLFFRLSTFYLHILPLRERQDDILLLARYFLEHFAKKYNKKSIIVISPEAEELLVTYNWPGNVRELRNLVERFVVLENIEAILPEHLPQWLTKEQPAPGKSSSIKFILPEAGISIEEMEKDLIMQALEKTNQNKTQAAKLLNMTYDAFRSHLKKYGIK